MDTIDTARRDLGAIRAKAALDNVPEQPGLYKLAFNLWDTTYVYIGEAGDLRRRIREYSHNPTKGNAGEYLLHELLIEAGEAGLSVCCLGLKPEKDRNNFERAKIVEARQQGLQCLNRGGPPLDLLMRRFCLESEERMLVKDLERVRSKLVKLAASVGSS